MLKSQENQIKGAPVEAKIGPRGAPQRFRKPGCRKDTLEQERGKQMAPKWDPKNILVISFDVFSHHCFAIVLVDFRSFWDQFQHRFYDLLRLVRKLF